MKTNAKLLHEAAEAARIVAEGYGARADYENKTRVGNIASVDEITLRLSAKRFVQLAGDLTAAADAILEADRLPTPMAIARELLLAERERLNRDHYASTDYNCDGCERMAAVVAELRAIG